MIYQQAAFLFLAYLENSFGIFSCSFLFIKLFSKTPSKQYTKTLTTRLALLQLDNT